jgi:TPR repeat protein
LQQERDRGARLERELASERETKDAFTAPELVIAAQVMRDKRAGPDAAGPAAKDQATVAVARSDTQPGLADVEVARLMARASALLRQGDIGSARSVLERAAETGNAQASFTLAETYDPLVLRKWGAYGTRGDAAKARILYAKAQAGGIKEAKERLDSLRR